MEGGAEGNGIVQTISAEYRAEQTKLHENPHYGVASVSYAPTVSSVINQLGMVEVLDYGCGKGRLAKALEVDHGVRVHHFDPAIPAFAGEPEPAEMVCCIDVLEHIEPDRLETVLDHLQALTKDVGFFSIHTGPAVKMLSDGRNAHLIQEDFRWWLPKIWARFDIHSMTHTNGGFYVVCNGFI